MIDTTQGVDVAPNPVPEVEHSAIASNYQVMVSLLILDVHELASFKNVY